MDYKKYYQKSIKLQNTHNPSQTGFVTPSEYSCKDFDLSLRKLLKKNQVKELNAWSWLQTPTSRGKKYLWSTLQVGYKLNDLSNKLVGHLKGELQEVLSKINQTPKYAQSQLVKLAYTAR